MRQVAQIFKLTTAQAIRSRLLLAFVVFSVLFQLAGMYLVVNTTFRFDLVLSKLGEKHAVFVALFLNLLSGFFISIIYGTWMIPYLHSGSRSELFFSLPIAKWKYPLAYILTLMLFFVLSLVLVSVVFATTLGPNVLSTVSVPWSNAVVCFLVECLVFCVAALGFAFSSLMVGTVLTLFCGAMSLFVLQFVGVVLRLPVEQWLGLPFVSKWNSYYRLMPPFGDLVFELRRIYFGPKPLDSQLFATIGVWLVWFCLLYCGLWYAIAHPKKLKSAEL